MRKVGSRDGRRAALAVASLAVALCTFVAMAADKNGVATNSISLPKGPGTIEGLGEAFQPTLNTGTAKYGVRFILPPGTAGHGPDAGLSYDAGGANGPFGHGWEFSLPYVQRETDKGIPRYDESDVFINDAKEELVPCAVDSSTYYFCKNEGAFARYERVGDHWEARLPNGTLLEFGLTPSGRVYDTQTPDGETTRVFRWLLESITDTNGNVIRYKYESFDGGQPDDHNTNQKYLAGIEYGPGAGPWTNFHFVRVEYDDRDDWFEDCRSGFVVRTGKRARDVVIGTQGPTLSGHAQGDYNHDGATDYLDRRYHFDYDSKENSIITAVTQFGADNVSWLPPTRFGYKKPNLPAQLSAAGREIGSVNEPSAALDNVYVELADLNGDALPDLLKTGRAGDAHRCYINEGETQTPDGPVITWSDRQVVGGAPQAYNVNFDDSAGKIGYLADMDGDGLADLVSQPTSDTVYYFKNLGVLSWGDRQRMATAGNDTPPAPFGAGGPASGICRADVDFDKRMDIVRGDGTGRYWVWFNLGNQQYSARVAVAQSNNLDLAMPRVVMEDFNGDRVPDVVQIKTNEISVAAGLGYGRFAPKVTIPFALPSEDLDAAKLQDITGDGFPDVVVLHVSRGEVDYWVNLGNYTLSDKKTITDLPRGTDANPVVRWADINGNGTTDYILSSNNHIRCVDIGRLMNCVPRAHMLTHIDNGLGRANDIEYSASTALEAADAVARATWPQRGWTDPLPFPVDVVTRVTTSDSLGGTYVSEFSYHDGYYDGDQKQFRGFASVELIERGDDTAPTLVTRHRFDVGRDKEAMKGKLLEQTAQREPATPNEDEKSLTFWDETTAWTTDPPLMTGTDGKLVVFARPASKEHLSVEQAKGPERHTRQEFQYDDYGNQTLLADYGIIEGADFGAGNDERVIKTQYAINLDKWIVRKPSRVEVMDLLASAGKPGGKILSRSEYYYDDPTFAGSNLGQVDIGRLTMTRQWPDPAIPDAYIVAQRTQYDAYGNPETLLDADGQAEGSVVKLAKGHARTVTYDPLFHAYPTVETIHLEAPKTALSGGASYDEGFGAMRTSTNFNGFITQYGYDVFSRLVSMVQPGDSPNFPTSEFDYALAQPFGETGLINYIESRHLDKTPGAGNKSDYYHRSRKFIDGLGRERMTKEEAEPEPVSGSARVAVKGAALFNKRRLPHLSLSPCYALRPGTDLDSQLVYEDIGAADWQGQFHEEGALVNLGLAQAHQTKYAYDALGRNTVTTNADGSQGRTDYLPLEQKLYDENDTSPDSPYHDTPMVHFQDGLGRLVRVDEITRLNPDGTPAGDLQTWTTLYQYDLNDQLTRIEDSRHNVKVMVYDGLKRNTSMDDPDRGVMKYGYDPASNLIRSEDAKGQVITLTYDGANRLLTEDYHDEDKPFSAHRVYDPAQSIGPANQPDVAYYYDIPVGDIPAGDNSTVKGENTLGQVAYVVDLSGEEHFSYDNRARAVWTVKRFPDPRNGVMTSYKTSFAYDSLDRMTALEYPDGDRISYDYNARTLIEKITGGAEANLNGADHIVKMEYAPSGQMLACRYGNGATTTHQYDKRLRQDRLITAKGADTANPFLDYAYTFDATSNIARIDDKRLATVHPAGNAFRNTQIFDYDDLYRITRVKYSFNTPEEPARDDSNDGFIAYRYDPIGNMLSQTSSIEHTERGQSVTNLGNMLYGGDLGSLSRKGRGDSKAGPHALSAVTGAGMVRQFPYDPNGNMTDIDGLACAWDFKDRMIGAEDAAMRAEYVYDYTNRRVSKKVWNKSNGPTSPAPALTTLYVNNYFEVREDDQPVKYVWSGQNRTARVTETLDPAAKRLQRFRLYPGWNLLGLAVAAPDGVAQLGLGTNVDVAAIYRWDKVTKQSVQVAATDPVAQGDILWVYCAANAVATVRGDHALPANRDIGPGDSVAANTGFEAIDLRSLVARNGLVAWRFDTVSQQWLSLDAAAHAASTTDDGRLGVGQAVFVKCPAQATLPANELQNTINYYFGDHLGSCSVLADAQGKVLQEFTYHPFGQKRNTPNTPLDTPPNRYGFSQKEADDESSLQYFEARYLVSSFGRFNRVDPLANVFSSISLSNPQKLNVYSYCSGSPMGHSDLFGCSENDNAQSEDQNSSKNDEGQTTPEPAEDASDSLVEKAKDKAIDMIPGGSFAKSVAKANAAAEKAASTEDAATDEMLDAIDAAASGKPGEAAEHFNKATEKHQQATRETKEALAKAHDAAVEGEKLSFDLQFDALSAGGSKAVKSTIKTLKKISDKAFDAEKQGDVSVVDALGTGHELVITKLNGGVTVTDPQTGKTTEVVPPKNDKPENMKKPPAVMKSN